MSDCTKIEWAHAGLGRGAPLTTERLHAVLRYDPNTGVFIWLAAIKISLVGARAGRIDGRGYRQIGIDGRKYMAAPLAWLYMTGEWPNEEIDHIDCIKDNNAWVNLRIASRSQNCAHKNLQSNNTSGFRGVSKCGGRWKAQINIAGRRSYLGCFDSPESAHAAYVEAARAEYGEFART